MSDEQKKKELIEQIILGIEGLLLTDKVSDAEKAKIGEEMLSILQDSKGGKEARAQ